MIPVPRTLFLLVLMTPALNGCTGANNEGPTQALIAAAESGDLDTVNRLIRQGIPLDEVQRGDGTALIVAARRGDTAIVQSLLDAGAKPDTAAHGDGNALIAAAAAGQREAAELLIAAGANVDASVPGDETPLINAAPNGHLDLARLLVENGADVNLGVVADRGQWRSPLNQAKDPALRSYLVGRGAVAERVPQANAPDYAKPGRHES